MAAAAGSALAGCASPALAIPTQGWLSSMTAALSASLIANRVDDALTGVWEDWQAGRLTACAEQAEEGYEFTSRACYGDEIPPAIIFSTSKQATENINTDRMIVGVSGGAESVVFDPWAWQALYLFVSEYTKGKTGDDLEGFRALCRISLVPSGTISSSSTATGRSELLTYKTRNGEVEMNRRTLQSGATSVQVVATGIPTQQRRATVKEFTL
jgi:hypothetical protein